MTSAEFEKIENYMKECMSDSAHDKEHIYRVLYVALDIASTEENVDYDILITSCLLHDIGRQEQYDNPKLCHAAVGSMKAYSFLKEQGWTEEKAVHVRDCICTHRFRSDNPPVSIEAKILFDADKIDVTGTMGVARTLVYKGKVNDPLYTLNADGSVNDGNNTTEPSFFHEYQCKLKKIYGLFYTKRGAEIGLKRENTAKAFYEAMFTEVNDSYNIGKKYLSSAILPKSNVVLE